VVGWFVVNTTLLQVALFIHFGEGIVNTKAEITWRSVGAQFAAGNFEWAPDKHEGEVTRNS
jgi:hypothetical protein